MLSFSSSARCPVKILYDHQIFARQVFGGISRYFFELMKQFKQNGSIEFELSLQYNRNQYLKDANFFIPRKFQFSFHRKSVINRRKSEKALSYQGFNVFHPTYYDTYFLKFIGNKPFVLTIHDMTHEIFSTMLSSETKIIENKRLLAHKAARIIAVSENTKKDIIRFYGIDEKKIIVTYLANSLSKPSFPCSNLQIPEKYILFVGGRGKYKNFEFFIKAITPLMKENESLNIVCAGGKPFSESEFGLFKELKVESKIHRFAVPDEILAQLYKNALAFVFPSLYEGFGIPVIEAFACGCPAILSNTGSLPEVGGDSAVYFDPTNETSIKETVQKTIYNEDLRNNLRIMGFKRLENFSWEKTASETYEVYRSIL